jgi:hypothetical protein
MIKYSANISECETLKTYRCYRGLTEVEREIPSEIAKTVQSLGGSPELVATIEGKTKEQIYRVAERLGADRYQLAAIGSWRDILSDERVLQDLRDWNEAPWETPRPHLRQFG